MNTLFQTIVGSQLYGLDNESSDTDIKGFGFPDIEALIGLNHEEQTEFRIDGDRKTEGTIYALEKYFRLSLAGNPSILDVAFADEKFHIISSNISHEVNKFIRENVITKHLFNPYYGYFKAQVRELNISKKVGVRAELVEKFGFDTKFASHAVRLGFQFCEIMRIGWLNPTLTGAKREICFDIKNGKYKLEDVNNKLTELEQRMLQAYQDTQLPEKPNKELWSTKLTEFHMEYIKCH